jgi:O-antigen ligase
VFINRNSAATYLGLGVVAVTALFIKRMRSTMLVGNELSGVARREAMLNELSGMLGLLATVWLVILTALLLTGSRGGIFATAISIVVMLVLFALRRDKVRSGSYNFGIVVVVIVGLLVVVEMAGANLLGRVLVKGFEDANRMHAAGATLKSALDHFWIGSGAGSFQSIFPLYRPHYLDGTGAWNRAHNDYVELLLTVGLPGTVAVVIAILSLTVRAFRGVFIRRRDGHYALIAVAATSLVGFHAAVDFSLQLQGVALTYAALVGLGVAQSKRTNPA